MDPREIQNGGDLTDAVIARNDLIEAERIKKLPLVLIKPPHHRPPPPPIDPERRNHGSPTHATDFCNKIGTSATSEFVDCRSGFRLLTDVHRLVSHFVVWPKAVANC